MDINTSSENQEDIFKSYSYQLHDRGFSFVPLNGKIPVVKNWAKYSKDQISDMVAQSWETQFPKNNIGLILGERSGIIAVDYDAVVEDPEVTKLIPRSMVERFGKKGFVRFYRYSGEVSRKFPNIQVEIFSDGGQVVLPPSVHPETKQPYKWTSFTTIYDIDGPEDLEPLPALLIKDLEELERRAKIKNKKKREKNPNMKLDVSIGGRNTTLFQIACRMVGDHYSRSTIYDDLISFDKNNHEIPWFSDSSEPHKGNVDKAVNEMIDRAASQHKGMKWTGEPLLSADNFLRKTKKQKAEEEELKKVMKEDKVKGVLSGLKRCDFPEPLYSLKHLRDFCLELSHFDRPKFALASSVELVGLLLSNKVVLRDKAPCLYQMLIAESGTGKDVPLNYPKNLLVRSKVDRLIGLTSYRGDKSVVKKFESQRERVDTIDEISKLFKSMNNKNSSALGSVAELLNELWSSSTKFFPGFTTAQGTTGLCYNPCLSLIGCTTPQAFSQTFTAQNVMEGFGGRFLFCYEDGEPEMKELKMDDLGISDPDYLPKEVSIFLEFWSSYKIKTEQRDVREMGLRHEDIVLKKGKGKVIDFIEKPIPTQLQYDEFILELMNDIRKEYFKLRSNVAPTMVPVVNRAFENLLKLTQIAWASRVTEELFTGGNDENLYCVSPEDVLWAKAYIDASLYEAARLFDDALVESEFHRKSVEVEKFIRSKGGKVPHHAITKRFYRRYSSYELFDDKKGLIPMMVNSGIIEEIIGAKEGSGRKPTFYALI